MRYIFARLGKKYALFGNFEKFSKMFDKKSMGTMQFLTNFGKVVAKNRAFGNTIIV